MFSSFKKKLASLVGSTPEATPDSGTPSQSSAAVTAASIPYSSYSVPVGDENDSSSASSSKHSSPRNSSNPNQSIDGIVVVSNAPSSSSSSGLQDDIDPHLAQLSALPMSNPLIKDVSIWRELFSSSKKEKNDPSALDEIDPKPLVDLFAEVQTVTMTQTRALAIQQETVCKAIREGEFVVIKAGDIIAARHEQVKSFLEASREVDRMLGYLEKTTQLVTDISASLQTLAAAIPPEASLVFPGLQELLDRIPGQASSSSFSSSSISLNINDQSNSVPASYAHEVFEEDSELSYSHASPAMQSEEQINSAEAQPEDMLRF